MVFSAHLILYPLTRETYGCFFLFILRSICFPKGGGGIWLILCERVNRDEVSVKPGRC